MTPDWNAAAAQAATFTARWAGQPGGVFVLFDRNGPRAHAAGGLASLEHQVPFTANTPSRYASISKHFLAATLLLEGFELESPLGTLLPDLPEAIGAVPLVRALTMTGGLPDMMEVLWQQGLPFTTTLGAEDIMRALRRVPGLCAEPGTEMAYSNTGWRLAQAALEAKAGRPYGAVLRERLLEPLGSAIAFPYDETDPVPGLATGYWMDPADKDRWRRGRYGLHISASGGLAGSANALAHWMAALMSGRGPLSGLLTRLLAPGRPGAYRLGLVETHLGGARIVGHGGSLPGYRNHLLFVPEAGIGVAFLSNRDEDSLPPALTVLAALLGERPLRSPGLRPGLFAAPEGPVWAELHPDAIEFMGARERLFWDRGDYRSVPGTLEMTFLLEHEAIEGRFGGVGRRLTRVPAGLALDKSLVGTWREPAFGAEIVIREDGTARFPLGVSLGRETTLTPLPGPRALATLPHLMWKHRPCLWRDGETLRLASHRARVLNFERQPE